MLPRSMVLSVLFLMPALATAEPSTEALWALVKKQQAQIEALQKRLAATEKRLEQTDQQVAEADEKIEATVASLEEQGAGASPGLGKFHFGSYGSLHYNHLDDKQEIDLHRFVLNFGYDFTEEIRFYSELELEHAFAADGENGEVELEQAYIDFDLSPQHTARGGLFLMPVGILNPTHEPTTFFGVERNQVETQLIPTTWWEGGAALYGDFGEGWHYEIDLHSGFEMPTQGPNAYLPRKGRQNVSEANAKRPAFTGSLIWRGYPGLEIGGALQYQTDVTQGQEENQAFLGEVHAVLRRGPIGLKALFAQWNINGDRPKAIGRDRQYGWYVEPAWYLFDDKVGLFARYEAWDNRAGSTRDPDYPGLKKQWTAGINYWPIPEVVLKADYQWQSGDADQNGFNLGIGYSFSF